MTLRFLGEPQENKRLRQMILASAILHAVVVLWVLTSSSLSRSLQPRAVAYTVELVSPEKLGTNLPGGRKSSSAGAEPFSSSKMSTAPSVASEGLQSKVVLKENPKPIPLPHQKEASKIQEKEKPVEKIPVKSEPEKTKSTEKKPEPQQKKPEPDPQKIAKASEPKPDVKTIAPKEEAKKLETKPSETKKPDAQEAEKKKSEPQKAETKPEKTELPPKKTEVKPEKTEVKPEKPLVKSEETSGSAKAEIKEAEENQLVKSEEVAADERDQRIAAALARIKAQTQAKGNSSLSEEMKGTGPVTKGGEFGEGGGGVVRGLEFLIYTQQLQKRVQENWIVAEKKPGLVASVSFMIEPNGNVQDIELTQSSGDGAFDQSVVRAIRKAAPFPPPPQLYVQEFATQKIYMNFGGEGRIN